MWQRHLRLRGDYDRNNRRLGPRPHQVYGEGEARVVALNDVDIDIEQGTSPPSWVLRGRVKSTLMHCLAGLDSVTEGGDRGRR